MTSVWISTARALRVINASASQVAQDQTQNLRYTRTAAAEHAPVFKLYQLKIFDKYPRGLYRFVWPLPKR